MSRNVAQSEEVREGLRTFYNVSTVGVPRPVVQFECVRIGDHAHVHVRSGDAFMRKPDDWFPLGSVGWAGKLLLRWNEWLLLREIFDADPRITIAEVERPTVGQASRYAQNCDPDSPRHPDSI